MCYTCKPFTSFFLWYLTVSCKVTCCTNVTFLCPSFVRRVCTLYKCPCVCVCISRCKDVIYQDTIQIRSDPLRDLVQSSVMIYSLYVRFHFPLFMPFFTMDPIPGERTKQKPSIPINWIFWNERVWNRNYPIVICWLLHSWLLIPTTVSIGEISDLRFPAVRWQ